MRRGYRGEEEARTPQAPGGHTGFRFGTRSKFDLLSMPRNVVIESIPECKLNSLRLRQTGDS